MSEFSAIILGASQLTTLPLFSYNIWKGHVREYPTMYFNIKFPCLLSKWQRIRLWWSLSGNSRSKLHSGNVANMPCSKIKSTHSPSAGVVPERRMWEFAYLHIVVSTGLRLSTKSSTCSSCLTTSSTVKCSRVTLPLLARVSISLVNEEILNPCALPEYLPCEYKRNRGYLESLCVTRVFTLWI